MVIMCKKLLIIPLIGVFCIVGAVMPHKRKWLLDTPKLSTSKEEKKVIRVKHRDSTVTDTPVKSTPVKLVRGDDQVKKEKYYLDLAISSTVPFDVAMKKDRIIVKKVRKKERGDGTKSLEKRKISLAMDQAGRDDYLVAQWPSYMAPFYDRNKLDCRVHYAHAGSAYNSSGDKQDMSALAFGEGKIYVKDVLLAARLVEKGYVDDFTNQVGDANGYLKDAGNVQLLFDGALDEVTFDVCYARYIWKDHVALGAVVPLVWKKHELSLSTPRCRALDNQYFRDKYGDCFKDFVKDFLSEKDICLTEGETKSGIGDLELFLSIHMDSHFFENGVAGIKCILPTGSSRRTDRLWSPDLGNGGFWECFAYGGLMFSKKRWLNPHFMAEAGVAFARNRCRRVPAYQESIDSIALKDSVRSTDPAQEFREIDTCLRRFATKTARVRLRKGFEAKIQAGNIFELSDQIYLDMHYAFFVKGSDTITMADQGNCCAPASFVPSIVKRNTYQVAHRVGVHFNHQYDENVRAVVGGGYTFAGRNTPEAIEASAAIVIEF